MGQKITKKELKEHLAIALKEIGKIIPKYSRKFRCWYFEHPLYPVLYSGATKEEVVANYPLYLLDFIEERLKENLSPLIEKKTKGRGGYRIGSGRPKGSHKEKKTRIYLPLDIATWIQRPESIPQLRKLIARGS